MRKSHIALSLFALTLFLIPTTGDSCTSFCLDKDRPIVGKNYDWSIGEGLIIVNKRGVKKVAAQYRKLKSDKPARWTSKFGSVTFNQVGREMPMGGINESGLVVELLLLDDTEYPPQDSRPTVSMLQWIQYQLDKFSTTRQVIESNSRLRIARPLSDFGMHYFICDIEGNSAVIEFLDGKFVCYTGEDLPVKVLANNTYEDSLDYNSGRFGKAAKLIGDYDIEGLEDSVSYAFHILDKVSQGSFTKWSIVYDLKDFSIHFKTYSNQRIRSINIRSLDYTCKTPVVIIDLDKDLFGDVTNSFIEYKREYNRKLIESGFRSASIEDDTYKELMEKLIVYPEINSCTSIEP